MKATCLARAVLVVLSLISATGGHLWAQSGTRLPGAIAPVYAGQFESLQAALNAADEGGLVFVPAGRFEISEPLVIESDDVSLVGMGTATHIVNTNEEGQPALLIRHPEGGEDRRQELWRVRVANLRITGNPQSGAGIVARHVNEIHLDGITVSENGGDGVLLDFCYEDPRVVDSLFTYNKKVGLNLIGCHDIVVSSNQFEENQDALHCIDSFNLCMNGNNLDDHLRDGVVIENTYGSVVSGNMIEECAGRAIVLDRNCYGDTLSANVIAHNGAGIDLIDAHGCAVSANTFTIMKTDALRIGPASSRITVAANNFSNSYIGDGEVRRSEDDRSAGGLRINGAKHINVSGNVFSGLTPKATIVEGESVDVMMENNVIVERE